MRRGEHPAHLPNEQHLVVRRGCVMCPRRGPVDLAICWACPAYRGLSGEPIERLICSADVVPGSEGVPGGRPA